VHRKLKRKIKQKGQSFAGGGSAAHYSHSVICINSIQCTRGHKKEDSLIRDALRVAMTSLHILSQIN
jgi:hypothetical protein